MPKTLVRSLLRHSDFVIRHSFVLGYFVLRHSSHGDSCVAERLFHHESAVLLEEIQGQRPQLPVDLVT